MEQLLFTNARIILPDAIADGQALLVTEGLIQRLIPASQVTAFMAEAAGAGNRIQTIDCGGQYLSPGFIDTHCHGGGGADFMDGTKEDILTAARAHLKHGTTGICPTTLTCSDDELFAFFDAYRQAKTVEEDMPHLLGIHLEGPYFSAAQAGAQPPAYLVHPEKEHYSKIFAQGGRDIVKWSAAPELPGAMELADEAWERGVLLSIGHSDATFPVVREAVRHGYRMLTHFYSGMSTITRKKGMRVLGVIESGYLFDELDVEIIADGIHLPPELLQLILRCKDHDKICLVTDSMRGADMPDGPSLLGSLANGVSVIIQNGIANMPDFSGFAGSVATTDRLVRVMAAKAGLPLWEAVRMASYNPARFLKVDDRYGSIQEGRSADLLVFDEDVKISSVYVGGVEVRIA